MSRSAPRRVTWVAAVMAVAAVAVYATRLDVSPIYLTHDEVIYARNAYSIAHTGRDLSGQLLPISIPVTGTFFATPANIYFTALFLRVLPVSEITVRLPSVVIGLLCVALVYFIARRIFDSRALGLVAAVILLLTPAHYIHSRLGTDHLYVVVCVLAWMAVLIHAGSRISARTMLVASGFLGLSLYTYLGALITGPACVGLTLTWLAAHRRRDRAVYVAALAGFAIAAVPFVAWHITHPGQYVQQIRMYALYDSHSLNPAQGAREMMAPTSMTERAAVYWDYFNPSFLFFAGDTGLLNGTRHTGVFLLPMLALLPIGLGAWLFSPSRAALLPVMVFLAAPLAAVVVGEPYRINRALIMLPAAAIIAAAGIAWLWRGLAGRAVAGALGLAMLLQFGGFYRDYFDGYRLRSFEWFEFNMRGGMEAIIREADASTPVWISESLQWSDYYWPFYLDRHGRPELAAQTRYMDATRNDLAAIAAGSFVLVRAREEQRFVDAGFTRTLAVREPDGSHSLSVLKR